MRDYGKVSPRFWTGTTGKQIRAMGPECQVVALYLMTAPSSSATGMYYLPIPVLAHETGASIEGARKALARLSEADFAHYDEATEFVWVPEMARHQIGDRVTPKDKRHPWLLKELHMHRKCVFAHNFWIKYREAFALGSESPYEGPPQAPSKPHRSQEQEQEQEHLQESAAPAPSGAVAEPTTRARGVRAVRKRRDDNPPPFAFMVALAALAPEGSRFVPGREGEHDGGVVISVRKRVRQFPDLAAWRTLGEFIAAGGVPFPADLGASWVATARFCDAMSAALAWAAKGKLALRAQPAVLPFPARSARPGPAAPSTDWSDDGPDPMDEIADAARRRATQGGGA